MKTQEGNWDDVVTAGTGCLSCGKNLSPLPASFYSGWRAGVRKENVHLELLDRVLLHWKLPQSAREELASLGGTGSWRGSQLVWWKWNWAGGRNPVRHLSPRLACGLGPKLWSAFSLLCVIRGFNLDGFLQYFLMYKFFSMGVSTWIY